MSYAIITQDVAQAANYLAQGRVAAFPTGTSYGLAVDALQGHALQRLRNLKRRPPQEKTFTVFLHEDLWGKFLRLQSSEEQLLRRYHKQALTLLVTPQPSLLHLAQDGRIGLRVIDHPLMAALAGAVEVPLTATSANVAGEPPRFTVAEVARAFPGLLDPTDPAIAPAGPTTYDLSLACILDGGDLPHKPPTTIARLEGDQTVIVRQGELTLP